MYDICYKESHTTFGSQLIYIYIYNYSPVFQRITLLKWDRFYAYFDNDFVKDMKYMKLFAPGGNSLVFSADSEHFVEPVPTFSRYRPITFCKRNVLTKIQVLT